MLAQEELSSQPTSVCLTVIYLLASVCNALWILLTKSFQSSSVAKHHIKCRKWKMKVIKGQRIMEYQFIFDFCSSHKENGKMTKHNRIRSWFQKLMIHFNLKNIYDQWFSYAPTEGRNRLSVSANGNRWRTLVT